MELLDRVTYIFNVVEVHNDFSFTSNAMPPPSWSYSPPGGPTPQHTYTHTDTHTHLCPCDDCLEWQLQVSQQIIRLQVVTVIHLGGMGEGDQELDLMVELSGTEEQEPPVSDTREDLGKI